MEPVDSAEREVAGGGRPVVVVTGAANGIGAALAGEYLRRGARAALLDADREALERRAAGFEARGGAVMALPCEVSSEAQCRAAVGRVLDRWGAVDVLVNNAGITQRGLFRETRSAVFERVMAVNFFGALYCTQAALESLIARRGTIVVVESLAGVTPLLGRSGYCASKHALHGLFSTLRAELRPQGVHVLIACPGFVRTDLQRRALGPDGAVARHPRTILGREATAEAVARRICRAALQRREMLVLTPVGLLGYWVSRFSPPLYERLMARQFRRERRATD
jgi:NAD(P)-dependent dehydrogenase (short-subunit alcohol dehydrogenase family)